jgi:hypothetical protein
MKIPHTVATKIEDDRELLDLLKAASPDTYIHRSVAFGLNIPRVPKDGSSKEENDAFFETIRVVAEKAGQTFSGIAGLTVNHLMKSIGMASVSGTAEALVKAIESDSVKHAFLSDRIMFRGASRS